MVCALDSGLNGPGSRPGRGTALCSKARHFTLAVPLSPPRCINGYRREGSRNTPSRLMLRKPG